MKLKYWQLAVGLGITLLDILTGESRAYTIIEIDKEYLGDVTIQRDKVTLQTKLQYGADGHSVQCMNQDEQQYTYKKDLDGEITKITKVDGGLFAGASTLTLPGRREYVDYTAKEIKNLKTNPVKRK